MSTTKTACPRAASSFSRKRPSVPVPPVIRIRIALASPRLRWPGAEAGGMVGPLLGERSVRVWIVGDNFGFPNGTGATARVHGFARALRDAGAEVRIFCVTPTELPDRANLNPEARGVHDGVAFEYACGTSTLPRAWLARR